MKMKANPTHQWRVKFQFLVKVARARKAIASNESQASAGVLSTRRINGPASQNNKKDLSQSGRSPSAATNPDQIAAVCCQIENCSLVGVMSTTHIAYQKRLFIYHVT